MTGPDDLLEDRFAKNGNIPVLKYTTLTTNKKKATETPSMNINTHSPRSHDPEDIRPVSLQQIQEIPPKISTTLHRVYLAHSMTRLHTMPASVAVSHLLSGGYYSPGRSLQISMTPTDNTSQAFPTTEGWRLAVPVGSVRRELGAIAPSSARASHI